MKFLFDLFPVILFFIAFKLGDAYIATKVAIAATVLQVGWSWFRHRKVGIMLWISLALVVVFGGLTLLLNDRDFMKWKVTALYWLLATVLLVSATLFRKNLIRAALKEAEIEAPDALWTKLNLAWVAFFAFMGALNLYVALSFSYETWVNFKLFGTMGLMLIFVLAQGFWLSSYMKEESPKPPEQPEHME